MSATVRAREAEHRTLARRGECPQCGYGRCPYRPEERIEMTHATQPEPPPTTNTGQSAHDLVITDLQVRKAMGLAKYGTTLGPWNGRRSIVDAYQEVLDLSVYLRNEIEERAEMVALLREASAALWNARYDETGRAVRDDDEVAYAIDALLRKMEPTR